MALIKKGWQNPFASRKAQTPEQMARSFQSLTGYTWQLPWGSVGDDVDDASGFVAIGTTETTVLSVDVEVVARRKYHISAQTQMYSPGGASNYAMVLKVGGSSVDSAEARPSSSVGTAVHIVNYIHEPSVSATVTVSVTGQFTTGGGTMLGEAGREMRLTVVDVGPAD
jgi:hypothetical protein